jgi:hypothetical protein
MTTFFSMGGRREISMAAGGTAGRVEDGLDLAMYDGR